MRTDEAFAAIDLGASSGRVVLGRFSDARIEAIEMHRFANVPRHERDSLVWDIDSMFAGMITGLRAAVAYCDARGWRLSGIGVDAWGVDYAVRLPDGRLGRAHHYRSSSPVLMRDALRSVSAARLFRSTGVMEHQINTAFRLRGDHVATVNGATILLMPDLMTYLLSGDIGTEPTIASTTGLLDHRSRDWSEEVLDQLGLSPDILPPVRPTGSAAGATTTAVTEAIGVREPITVYRVAGHDTASAMSVLADWTDGGATGLLSCGTWSLAGVATPGAVTRPAARRQRFTNEVSADGSNLLLRNLNGMWLVQECLRRWSARDGRPVSLEALLQRAETAVTNGARFDTNDPSLLAPVDMPDRIAELCIAAGHPAPQSRGATVRVILESLADAFSLAMKDGGALAGVEPRRIRIGGGGARNRLLCRLTADASGLPVSAGPSEASSLGNLASQLVAAGICSSLNAALAGVQELEPLRPVEA